MFLGLWGRFSIMAAGGFVVIVAVIVVTCFVGPGCWGFEYLQKEDRKKKQIVIEKIKVEPNTSDNRKAGLYWMDNNDYVIYQTGTRDFEEKIPKIEDPPPYHSKENVFNLKCAPLLIAPNLYSNAKEAVPKLEIKLSYLESNQEDVPGRLTVHIIEVTCLRCREYIATLDPFIMLEILNNKWSLQKNERIVHTVQTGVVSNNTNPTFDQRFVFHVKKIEMKNWCLKLTLIDNDRLTKVTPLFEKRIYLKDIKNLTANSHVPLTVEMQEVTLTFGALLFGISYLPTAQRLNINVIKANKLKYQGFVKSLVDFYPYVRVVMVNNHGKCLKKKKTCIKQGDDSPIFNQSLVFDLSISNLEQTGFLVLLCTKILSHGYNSDDSSLEGDIETALRQSKDKVLGTIVLGRNVRCTRARDHWVTVMQHPRKMISVWHELR